MRSIGVACAILSFAAVSVLSFLPCFAQDAKQAAPNDYFFLRLEGKGMPVKHVVLNGTDVLGGSVVSVSLPINVTSEVQKGLNKLEVDFVSDEDEGLTTVMEKRTPGPKKTEIARLSMDPGASHGKVLHKIISFNVASKNGDSPVKSISAEDKKEILARVGDYYKALDDKDAGKLRALYQPSLKLENKVCPEGARYFEKALNKEIALLRRKDVKMEGFSIDDTMLELDGDKVKVLRKDRKPLMMSNEIDVQVTPLLTEIDDGKSSGKAPKAVVKQRLVTTKLLFRKIDGSWLLALPQGV